MRSGIKIPESGNVLNLQIESSARPRSTDNANSKKKRGTAQKMDSFTNRQDRRVQQDRSQNIGVNPSSSNEQRGAVTTSSPPFLQLHQPEPVISQPAVSESQPSVFRSPVAPA
jgi:hypothetical protein